MFKAKTHRTMASLVFGVACLAAPHAASAASPIVISGAITGVVSNNLGIPQMGATVLLYNKQDRALTKIQTDARGEFKFAGLLPDLYSIRVSLAAFLPAFKRDIQVQPGMRSALHVSLSTLLSTIQLSYPAALESGSIMSDDWKWILRTGTATRPILRLIEPKPGAAPVDPAQRAAIFSDMRGVLKVSAGEGSVASNIANEADMGTAFALATSLYGNNLLQVSGNVGYGSQTGTPSAAFRTSYSRNVAGTTPEVSLTMRQLFMPARFSAALAGNDAALPMLRSMSASFDDSAELADGVTLRYGTTLDAVTFLDHLSYFSPYAQLTVGSLDSGKLQFTYTSGNARPELGAADSIEADLQHDLNTLGMFPRISLRGGRSKIQRGEDYEIAYSRRFGSRTYALSAYHELIHNAALSMVSPEGMFSGGDVLPDLFTGNSIFNIGDHQNSGFSAALSQSLGEHITATVTYGSEGALAVGDRELLTNSPDELRSRIRAGRKHAATARVNLTAPRAGTHVVASYQVSDQRWAMSGNLYSTQPGRQLPGLNVYIRQPLPRVGLLPWRMEATADLRNMLAQGYLPLTTAGGQRVLLVDTPRSFRGGLSFIF
jgi:hypothetical protein